MAYSLIYPQTNPLRCRLNALLDAVKQRIVCAFSSSDTAVGLSAAVRETAEHLMEVYGNSILRLAYSYLHNREDAEEVVQDTLLQYMRTAPEFTDAAHEKAWCLRVAGNLSKNCIQYNRIRGADELDEQLVAEEREDLSFIWDAVKALPVNYREVVHLFYHEGYSTAEIAGILGRKETTVRSDLSRGRAKLREALKEAYDFER